MILLSNGKHPVQKGSKLIASVRMDKCHVLEYVDPSFGSILLYDSVRPGITSQIKWLDHDEKWMHERVLEMHV